MSDYYLVLVNTSADATNADTRAERLLTGLRLLCPLLILFYFVCVAEGTFCDFDKFRRLTFCGPTEFGMSRWVRQAVWADQSDVRRVGRRIASLMLSFS